MNESDKGPSCLYDPNFLDLIAFYINHPIALYTGSGVSWSDNPNFGVGLWDDFVRRTLSSDANTDPKTIKDFEKKLSKWKDKPWEIAKWVAGKIGKKSFQHHATALIQRQENFQKEYKLLSGKFLKKAGTLNATVAFCADFASGKISKGNNGQWSAVYQRSINHRVHAVVTSNYDPFLEAASSTMFRKPILKPVAKRDSSAGNLMEIPVFHIHGYVPFPSKFQKQETAKHTPLRQLVITTTDYESAWKADDVYNFTMGPQIHILRHYVVLFVGFSFRDEWVNHLLRTLNKERNGRQNRLYHYAIMKQDEVDAQGSDYFKYELGVKPIAITSFSQIKDLLGHLYEQGLIQDHQGETEIKLPLYEGGRKGRKDRCISLSPTNYFEELYKCRLSMVHKKKL